MTSLFVEASSDFCCSIENIFLFLVVPLFNPLIYSCRVAQMRWCKVVRILIEGLRIICI